MYAAISQLVPKSPTPFLLHSYVIRKVLRNLYEDIIVDFQGITRVRALVEEDKVRFVPVVP